MTYAISVSRILEVVYALSAVKAAGTEKPPVIGERQEKALRRLAYHCMCRIVAELPGIVNITEEPNDMEAVELIILEGNVDSSEPLGCSLRVYLENALTAAVMASAWEHTDPGVGNAYSAVIQSNINSIRCHFGKCNYRIRRAD